MGTTNRLSAAGYDAAGNQTTWGTYGYTWDLMGLMKAYQGSGNDWAYAYDADDERMLVYNVVTGQSTFRIRGLDGKVLREVKLTGSTWSWGKDWIYRDGQLLATTAPGSVTRYAHADHLGSPRLFTDASGVVKDRYHYYPFGEQAGTAPTTPEALRFTGHERDSGASTGTADDLDYMHARYYHPQLGRFLSVDPARTSSKLKQPLSWNRYAYALANPLKFIDPDGRESLAILAFEQDAQALLHGEISREEFQARNAARAEGVVTGISILGNVGLGRLAVRGVVGLYRASQIGRTAHFASRELLVRHFQKHGAEFGARTAKGYLRQAQAFVRREGLESVTRANGDRLLYDAAKNEFAVLTKDGTIRTFFKPDKGLEYWTKQVEQILQAAG